MVNALTSEKREQILALHARGLSLRAIAVRVGVHKNTVQRYVRAGAEGVGAGDSAPARMSERATDE